MNTILRLFIGFLAVAIGDSQNICDYGTGHGFLIFPADPDRCDHFVLSHGSAFECPHEYDIKVLASFENEDDQQTFCDFLDTNPNSTSNVFGGELPNYGLQMIMDGHMHHMHGPLIVDFFSNMTILLDQTGLVVERLIYGRQYTADPPSSELEYLIHVMENDDGDQSYFVSHYIAVPPSFDHIGFVKINASFEHGGAYLLSFPGIPDDYNSRLQPGYPMSGRIIGTYWNDVEVTLLTDIYHGYNDELVSLLEYCPDPSRPRWDVCPN